MPPVPNQNPASFTDEDLKNLWHWNMTNHQPTPEAIRKIEGLRSCAMSMADAIIDMAPHSRERSMALSNLEATLFYANAAVARNENVDTVPVPPTPIDDKPEEDKALEAEQTKEDK